jgi:ankyrin repeat protein
LISIRTGDKNKRVSNSYAKCSRDADTSRVELARLAERIERVAGIARWIKCDNQSLTDAIKSGLDVNSQSSSGETSLIVAIRQKMVPRVLLLLHARAQVDLADAHGVTPLMWATMTQQPLVVRELLRRGADATAKNENEFRAAQLTGDPEVLTLLPSST